MLTDAGAIGFSLLALRARRAPGRGRADVRLPARWRSSPRRPTASRCWSSPASSSSRRSAASCTRRTSRAGLVLRGRARGRRCVNLAAAWTLARADRSSLNVEGSFQHVADRPVRVPRHRARRGRDPRSSASSARTRSLRSLIAALMIRSGSRLVKASGRIFLEAAPEGLDPQAIGRALVAQPGVVEVHDLHVWEVSSGFPALSAHVLVDARRPTATARAARWRRCCTSASGSTTRRCRSTTPATTCSRSRPVGARGEGERFPSAGAARRSAHLARGPDQQLVDGDVLRRGDRVEDPARRCPPSAAAPRPRRRLRDHLLDLRPVVFGQLGGDGAGLDQRHPQPERRRSPGAATPRRRRRRTSSGCRRPSRRARSARRPS